MISTLPKILLHVHTETTRRINAQIGIPVLSQYPDLAANPSAREFYKSHEGTPDEHKQYYGAALISELVFDILSAEASNNVIYTEFRYNPIRWMEAGLSLPEIFLAIRNGMIKANKAFNMLSGSIICFRRGTPIDSLLPIIDTISRLQPAELVGVDLAGDEKTFSDIKYLRDSFRFLKSLGLGICVHAGEFGEPENIWQAIVELQADRIGHGLSASKDSALVDYLINKRIMLEISLSSNLWLKAVKDLKEHPVRFFVEKGVLVSLNTDIPALVGTNMTHEFELAHTVCGLSLEELELITINSNNFSFANDDTKRIVEKKFKDEFEDT